MRCLVVVYVAVVFAVVSLLINLTLVDLPSMTPDRVVISKLLSRTVATSEMQVAKKGYRPCATVEEMGDDLGRRGFWKDSLRVRRIINQHFVLNGATRVRNLPPEQFCGQGFVLGKALEAGGFGNEMYRILTAAALSIMLNRSLIISQTRDKFPFEDYISYSEESFTMKEVKHLWQLNNCEKKHGRRLLMKTDNFQKPSRTNVLCGDWSLWTQPIIRFQGTTDAVAIQFFLKNVNPEMRSSASNLFGESRPNVFGELMRFLVSPSKSVKEAVSWVLAAGTDDPDVSLHMRMLNTTSREAEAAALKCIRKLVSDSLKKKSSSRPKVVLLSDTPSIITTISQKLSTFADVLHFNYQDFRGNVSKSANSLQRPNVRAKDWGPAPRWVAFVDFFLASRAKHAVVSGAHRRVGTTYAQLIAALAAANSLGDNSTDTDFCFISSFQSKLLRRGLSFQIGWGHVWNRFSGLLSCHKQKDQCALTPLLPPAWWDGLWQSPIPRDVRRLKDYGVRLSDVGVIDENHLHSFCDSRKDVVETIQILL